MRAKHSVLVAVLALVALSVFGVRSSRAQEGVLDPLAPEPETAAPDVVVDDDLACPNATETSIQTAVTNASPGDIVQVCPGLYPEQVVIDKPLTVRGRIFNNEERILIKPVGVVANTTSLVTAAPIGAIVLVDNTTSVTLSNLTVDGADNGITGGCGLGLVGIFYRNASGVVNNTAVRNILLGSGLEGCQTGLGIFAQSGGSGSSNVIIKGNSVHDYQKAGIVGNEPGTRVTVLSNAVTGLGPTPFIAQNGIQVAFGAKGIVEGNLVTDHNWTLCVSTSDCPFVSTDILVFDGANSTRVQQNHVGRSQTNIFFIANNGFVNQNDVFDADVWDGMDIIGDNNDVIQNKIFNSDEAAVFIQGNNTEVRSNFINDARVGIQEDASNTGTVNSGNQFHNLDLRTEALVLLNASKKVQKTEPARP